MLRPPNKSALSLSLSHSRYVFCTILHSAYFNSFPVFHSPLVFVTLFSCPVSLDTRTGAGFLPPLATLGGTRRRRPFPGTRLITTESELDRKIETLTATKKYYWSRIYRASLLVSLDKNGTCLTINQPRSGSVIDTWMTLQKWKLKLLQITSNAELLTLD